MIPPASSAARPLRTARSLVCKTATAALLVAGAGLAQVEVVRPRPPAVRIDDLGVIGTEQASEEAVGPRVRMPVSLNIDRHLRKAQGFLERENWTSAFQVLQDVIDGRTLTDDEAGETPPEPAEPGDLWDAAAARQAVFSDDERVYRPVKSLCHGLLASLPPAGIAAYRTLFEFEAERRLEAARAACDVSGLEQVVERYFVTLSAAHALELAGDLRMDRGQFRAALRDYRVLLEVYPEAGRREAGIDEAYVHGKVALSLSMLGAQADAERELAALTARDPAVTLRIEGELVAAPALAEHLVFDSSTAELPREPDAASTPFLIASDFVPLWEFRFEQPRPYRPVHNDDKRRGFSVREGSSAVSVSPSLHAPGTAAVVAGDRIAFLDHFRLRVQEALSGRMLLETDEPLDVDGGKLSPDTPRARVAVYDFATMPVAHDRERWYAVIGKAHTKDMDAVLENRLVAYDAATLAEVWTSESHAELSGVTFLATPTVDGSKLLAPILDQGTFGLQAVEAATGEPLYRVAIHRGGTILARPPASPVVVDQGTAFVLSNAGALAAVDVHTGSLSWIRRYERQHPLRPIDLRQQARQQNPFGFQMFSELSHLPGFAPSELVAVDGLVVLAPSDGNVLMCLDGASGEPVWMLNRVQTVPPLTHLEHWQYLIGDDGRHLLVASDQGVTCIELRSGVRLWRHELPSAPGQAWRGRGVVARGHVIVPGTRELCVRPIEQDRSAMPWRRVPLPELSIGRPPLDGAFNLEVSGIFLVAVYESGVEVYSTVDSLLHLADATDEPELSSLLQAQAGDLVAAFATLERVDIGDLDDPVRRRDVVQRLLTIGRELAVAMAAHGADENAVEILDRCRGKLTEPRDVMLWHLARIEVFQTLGDLDRIDAEQRALYALMEGR